MSKRTARLEHPLIDNPEQEEKSIVEEALNDALLQGLQQQGAAGAIPPSDIAAIQLAVAKGKPLAEAVDMVQKAAQARQAQQAPPPGPGQVTSPEAQPGIAQPGTGAEQPPGQIPAPDQDLNNLRSMLTNLNAHSRV